MGINKIIRNIIKEEISKTITNFKKWFSGSKIIKGGKPLIVYHGSDDPNIEIFDFSKIGYNSGNYGHYGHGIYFSMDKREAKTYGEHIYECYINIKKPFIGTDKQVLELKNNGAPNIEDLQIVSIDFNSLKKQFKNNLIIYDFLENLEQYGVEKAWGIFHNSNSTLNPDILNDLTDIVQYSTLNKDVGGVPHYIIELLNEIKIKPKFNYSFAYDQSLHWITDLGNASKEVTDIMKKLGYDGVWYGSEVVAFYPNQIKSIHNDGSWNIEDNNIFS